MGGNIHGMKLVDLLAESDAEIVSQPTLLDEKKVNGYEIKGAVLSYDNGINIGIFYLIWSTPIKRRQETEATLHDIAHHNLAVVGLESNDEGAAKQTIDTLMGPSNIGISHLRTPRYLIADGSKAAELYNVLVTEPPATAMDLANVLGQYTNKRGRYRPQGWASIIPDPQMRIRLGRGV